MAPGRPNRPADREGFADNVVGALLGPNPFVGLTGQDVASVLGWIGEHAMTQPTAVMEQQAALVRELIGVVAGRSTLATEKGERGFRERMGRERGVYGGRV